MYVALVWNIQTIMATTLSDYAKANGINASTNGFSCPECPVHYGKDEVVASTNPTYYAGPNGCGYEWFETHKCCKCGKLYAIHNGN